jgi:hypothetical protein
MHRQLAVARDLAVKEDSERPFIDQRGKRGAHQPETSSMDREATPAAWAVTLD